MKPEFPIKLVKFIASAGIASRRKSFDLIKTGHISINGEVNREPSTLIAKTDQVSYKNKPVSIDSYIYVMLNKPVGFTCTNSDPHAKKKAVDLIQIPDIRLFSIGRLDKNSEGLILFTNDGKYADQLMHPRNEIKKTYIVKVSTPLTENNINRMTNGILDSGETLKAFSIKKKTDYDYEFILTEGKKREIRRLVEAIGSKVISLKRISIGKLNLEKLPIGKWKELTYDEIKLALKN